MNTGADLVCALSHAEQMKVRAALQFLRRRCGGWKPVANALKLSHSTISKAGSGDKDITPDLAFRVARFAKVAFDDLLRGAFPSPGTCPYCGAHSEGAK